MKTTQLILDGADIVAIYQVINGERGDREANRYGSILFEGSLADCYQFQRTYSGSVYPDVTLKLSSTARTI